MTITNTTRLVRHLGNGVTTAFPFTFLIPTGTLVVSLYNLDTGVLSVLSSAVYSVTGLDDSDGGEVTYPLTGSPIDDPYALVVKREVSYSQDLVISNQSGFHPETIEEQLDLIVMQTQQLAEETARSFRFVEGADVDEDSLVVPEPEDGAVLGWNGVTLTNIVVGSVELAIPANSSVTTVKIADDAVTADKLDSGAGLDAILSLLDLHTKGANTASATTVDLDAVAGDWVNITGTTTIVNFTLTEGHHRLLRFASALTITYGATTIITPGATSISIAAGDLALLIGGPSGADYFFPLLMNSLPLLRAATDQPITGGAIVTPNDLGTISSGTVTPDPGDRPQHYYTNGGAHTLAPASNKGSYILQVLNSASAGAITTSGFTKVSGAFNTTNGNKFLCSVVILQSYSFLSIQALQ